MDFDNEFCRSSDVFCNVELISHSEPYPNDKTHFLSIVSVLASAVHILKLERYRED